MGAGRTAIEANGGGSARRRPQPSRGIGAALLGAGLIAACGSEPQPELEPITVAVAVPFAGTGVMADARQGWQLVLDSINEAGGVAGRPLQVVERDTPLSAPDDLTPIAEGFTELASEGYRYIISLASGDALEPMMQAATTRGVLTMSITSEEPAADVAGYDALLLRGILSTDRLIAKQAAALQARGLRHLAIVGATRAAVPAARHQAMRGAYELCADCTVSELTYPAEMDPYYYDWPTLGEDVVSAAPDVVYLAAANVDALRDSVRAIEAAGYAGSYHFAHGGYMGALLPAFLPQVTQRFRSYDLALPPGAQSDEFFARYESRYGEAFVPEPRLVAFADYLALLALAMTQVGADDPARVALAMKELAAPPGEAHGPLDYAAASAAVRAGKDVDFVGLSGPLDFDERGEVADGFAREYAVDASGAIVPLP
jgi:branched-chain amino acid transport system substrate-binding protein